MDYLELRKIIKEEVRLIFEERGVPDFIKVYAPILSKIFQEFLTTIW